MKTKFNLYIFILILFSFADLAIGQECNYDSTDLNITLNGWDLDRTDYTHERFIVVAGLKHDSQLDYSGEKDTQEFGYPWYYYYSGNNYIHFAGVMDSQGDYNGLKRISSFVIKERGVFNVNGIQVGDTKSDLRQAFSGVNFCSEMNSLGQEEMYFWYEYFALSIFISPDNTIVEIKLSRPI